MGRLSTIVRALVMAQATPEMILAAVEAAEGETENALEKRRASDRERQARRRHVTSRDVTVTPRDIGISQQNLAPAPAAPAEFKQLDSESNNEKGRKKDSAPKALSGVDAFRHELEPVLDAERIEALCAVRRAKKAAFSGPAGKGIARNLMKCPDPIAAADEMILRGWVGIKPEWLENHSRYQPPRERTILDAIDEKLEKHDDPFAAYTNGAAGENPTADLRFIASAKRP